MKSIDKIILWRNNPVAFVKEEFGVTPDPWQENILMLFVRNQRLAMKACKGPGKTCVLAWLAWNFLVTRPHPKVIATSISGDNLADGLWAEMSKWQQKSDFLKNEFTWTKTKITYNEFPETWFMSARQWSKSSSSDQQANTLAGIHADYVLFMLDESGGIPDSVMAAAEGALSSGVECKIVQAGNPTHLEGPLYRACTSEAHLWAVVEITGDPDDPNRSPRISIQWAREQIQKYGRDNPWVLINVFGKFPPSSINSLLGPDEVKEAINRGVKEELYMFSQKRLGIDVALEGDDRTVIFPRQGLVAFKPVEMRNARPSEIAARITVAKMKWGSEIELVDNTGGFGSGVVDNLIQFGYTPIPIHFASKANQSDRYYNLRSEMWWEMAEWIKRGACLPNIPELIAELTTPTYTLKNGKFIIEPKEQIKERLGFSPDYGDALALTFALPEAPSKDHPSNISGSRGKMKSDYDPFSPDRF